MNMDSNIRVVTICDINGKMMYSDYREGIENLLTPEESKKSLESRCKFMENTKQTCTKDRKRKICVGRI